MNKTDFQTLLLKHDTAIGQLERASGQMMLLWKAVGAVALVAIGAWLTSVFGGDVGI